MHPNLDGTTQANKPSTDADLSVTSLTAGVTSVEQYVDERGLKRPTKAVLLYIAVDNWNVAEELLGSEFKPFTANNEINALQKRDLSFFLGHYLTDKICVPYISNGIEKIVLNCGKLLRALTTKMVTMLGIGQSAANQLILAVQRLHGQPQLIG